MAVTLKMDELFGIALEPLYAAIERDAWRRGGVVGADGRVNAFGLTAGFVEHVNRIVFDWNRKRNLKGLRPLRPFRDDERFERDRAKTMIFFFWRWTGDSWKWEKGRAPDGATLVRLFWTSDYGDFGLRTSDFGEGRSPKSTVQRPTSKVQRPKSKVQRQFNR